MHMQLVDQTLPELSQMYQKNRFIAARCFVSGTNSNILTMYLLQDE